MTAVLGMAVLPLQSAWAQDSDSTGGQSLGFTVSEAFSATRNLSLVPGGDETTSQAVTSLGFSFDDITRTSAVGFTAAMDLRAAEGPQTDGLEISASNPRVSLSYAQEAADASIALSGSFSTDDVAYIRPLTDFLVNGVVVLPEDFADLSGSGNRRSVALDGSLSIRNDAPFGLTFTAGVRDIGYSDTSSATLLDSTRINAGIAARFDISDVLQATAALRYGRLDEAGAVSETYALTAGANLLRPDGAYGLSVTATDSGSASQVGFRLSRDITFRSATLSGGFGLTRGSNDVTSLTGSLDYALTRPSGTFSVSLDRDVVLDGAAADVLTSLSVGASRELTPDLGAALRVGFARDASDSGVTDLADVQASVSYQLAPDWSLSAGASYELRDEAAGRATAQSLSLTVSRSFGARN